MTHFIKCYAPGGAFAGALNLDTVAQFTVIDALGVRDSTYMNAVTKAGDSYYVKSSDVELLLGEETDFCMTEFQDVPDPFYEIPPVL